jgi:hypothetical protein
MNTGTTSVGASSAAITATDTSTTQILELVAQRREQQAQTCPAGYISVNGSCEPAPAAATATPAQAPQAAQAAPQAAAAPAPPGASSTTGGQKRTASVKPKSSAAAAAGAPQSTPASFEEEPPAAETRKSYGAWVEGFADYEERENLNISGASGVERSQRVAGMVAGIDRLQRLSAGSGVVFGMLGGYNNTRQKYSPFTGTNPSVPTSYSFFIDANPQDGVPDTPGSPAAVFELNAPHTFNLDIEQRTEGGTVGGYTSYYRGNFFIDGLFKVDIMNLTRRTKGTDTFPREVTNDLNTGNSDNPNNTSPPGLGNQEPGNLDTPVIDGEGNVCFSGDPRPLDFSDTLETVNINSSQSTDFRNYVLASNIGYHFDLDRGYWFEPTGRITYTFAHFDSDADELGLDDGHTLRLQAGGRLGKTIVERSAGRIWTAAVGAYLYSDVLIEGFVADGQGISSGPLEQDEGKLRVLGSLLAQVTTFDGYSVYAEGEVRGGEDYWGVGGKLGARVEW